MNEVHLSFTFCDVLSDLMGCWGVGTVEFSLVEARMLNTSFNNSTNIKHLRSLII